MNIRVDPHSQTNVLATEAVLASAALTGARAYRNKFHPRFDVLDQVIAGLLWLQLDLPDDVSRTEMEAFARRLIGKIRNGFSQAAIEGEITILQCAHFGRRANALSIHDLARRARLAVNGA